MDHYANSLIDVLEIENGAGIYESRPIAYSNEKIITKFISQTNDILI